ncbi:MAG: helix-turn-helix domain-containing protein [Nostoc sp. NMS7]|uniref:helix-turn-helix domain-containing protein n=1 Tax=Nostoc sp. NMS7 TaxID=2815391 RepID=UPI0025EDA7ED|nr:helix-turn-helix domain-containing protein [Nostoc sp. NMS7]MBN3948434.1 helix-turn-helix domain-containing protein [Nostoc sp. NMS7]
MPLKMGAPRTIQPDRVKELITQMEQEKIDWTYAQLADIITEETGVTVTANSVSSCALRNGIVSPKIHGRKRPKPTT